MTEGPKISVLTPVYNCAHYISRCIESVRSQGYPLTEHIIVDGGSKDGTTDILSWYPNLVWISEPDTGEANALNKAIRLATGDLLVWLNGDDWLEPGAFDAVLKAHANDPYAGVLYGSVRMVHEKTNQSFIKSPLPEMGMPELIRWWLTDNHPHQPGMYFSREALRGAGLFNEELHFSIDYEYWLRLARVTRFTRVNHVLANALLRVECKSAGTEVDQIKSHWNVLMPYVRALPHAAQERYWKDYFCHRFTHPMIFEKTRLPEDEAALEGLVLFLTEGSNAEVASRFSTLFPDHEVQTSVTKLLEGCASRRKNAQTPAKKVRVAEDYAGGVDLTKIGQESDFARGIREVFSKHRPTKIIETGTYLGTGTTAVIASTLRDLDISNALFYSIEVNPNNVARALENLRTAGLNHYVQVCQGLSVPREVLPTVEQIEDSCVRNIEGDDIFVDHREHNRASLYYQETHFDNVEDDLLGKALRRFNNKPDFVILDSAGHMGFVEFKYLLERLQAPCIIALDDVYHIKHHRSFSLVKRDPRFNVLVESREKFGFCIAEFRPTTTRPTLEVEGCSSKRIELPPSSEVSRILFVRTDAIGDSVLAASLLEPIKNHYPKAECAVVCQKRVAPLYHACPYVSTTFTFDDITAEKVKDLQSSIQRWNPHLVINSAYSRDTFSDLISVWAAPSHRVAFVGDGINSIAEYKTAGTEVYTSLVEGIDPWMPELRKYDAFLKAMGISAPPRTPIVWRDSGAETFAEDLFRQMNIPTDKAIAFAPGARVESRVYDRYAETLAMLADRGYVVIGIGAAEEEEFLKRSAVGLQLLNVSLFGKSSLLESAAVIARCHLFIGAESSPAHLACAVGTPNVVVLGGGHYGRFMPYSPLTSAVVTPFTCSGCNWGCRYETVACVKDIDPLAVRQAVEDRLTRPTRERAQLYLSIPHVAQRGLRMYPSLETDLDRYSEFGDVIVVRDGTSSPLVTRPTSHNPQNRVPNPLASH